MCGQKIESAIWEKSTPCMGKPDTDKAYIAGVFFGWIVIDERKWAIVKWEDEDDPTLHKAEHLKIEVSRMVDIQ